MGFALVYALGRKLYPDGFDCAGERCPSNDHSNRVEATHHKDAPGNTPAPGPPPLNDPGRGDGRGSGPSLTRLLSPAPNH
jgi:hypothetical protein